MIPDEEDDLGEFLPWQREDPVLRFYHDAARRRSGWRTQPLSKCKEVLVNAGDVVLVLLVCVCWFWHDGDFRDRTWLVLASLVIISSVYFTVDTLITVW